MTSTSSHLKRNKARNRTNVCSIVGRNVFLLSLLLFDFPFSIDNDQKLPSTDIWSEFQFPQIEAECRMTTPELIKHLGYTVEIHHVTTKDGYILELHRIPYGKLSDSTGSRKIVFLMHGAFCSSADWVINLANESLGFILADKGFDVWLGNFRGNIYSTNHVSLSTESKEFWDYSFDEVAKYDIPNSIDYILNTTSMPDLYYIGHSMGVMSVLAHLSSTNASDSKIKLLVGLGAVGSAKHILSKTVSVVAALLDPLTMVLDFFGVYHLTKVCDFFTSLAENLCTFPTISETCVAFWESIIGKEGSHFNRTRLIIYLSHMPSRGFSVQNLAHILRNFKTGLFGHRDYGLLENLQKYGQTAPPEYDLTKVNVATALISGSEDLLSPPEESRYIARRLPNLVDEFEVPDYSHFDLVWESNYRMPVTRKVLTLLDDTV